jgi:hypothetical protein
MTERCAICGCELHRTKGTYASPTVEGRSHASKHHFLANRFFGRSNSGRGTQRDKVFKGCPWGSEGQTMNRHAILPHLQGGSDSNFEIYCP